MNIKYLLAFLFVSFFSFTNCHRKESEHERKSRMFKEINAKYDSLGFMGFSDAVEKMHRIDVYSSIQLGRSNIFDSINIKNYSDSLKTIFIDLKKFSIEELLADMDSINSFSKSYLSEKESLWNDANFKTRLLDIYRANGKVEFEDLLFYFDNSYFKLNPNSDYHYVSTIHSEDIEKWMLGLDGLIIDFEYSVKEMLDNPDSFEHVETSYNIAKNQANVKMRFRAKNKFGAVVTNLAFGVLNIDDGSVSNIRID